jgi:hypothetical protein
MHVSRAFKSAGTDVNRFLEPLLARIRVTPLSTDLLPSVDASAATAIGECVSISILPRRLVS